MWNGVENGIFKVRKGGSSLLWKEKEDLEVITGQEKPPSESHISYGRFLNGVRTLSKMDPIIWKTWWQLSLLRKEKIVFFFRIKNSEAFQKKKRRTFLLFSAFLGVLIFNAEGKGRSQISLPRWSIYNFFSLLSSPKVIGKKRNFLLVRREERLFLPLVIKRRAFDLVKRRWSHRRWRWIDDGDGSTIEMD